MCGRPGLALWEAGSAGRMGPDLVLWEPGSAGRMGPDLVLWEPGSAGRMEAEGLPAVLLALAHAARSPSVSIRSGNPSSHREPFGLHSIGEPELPQGALRSPFARGTRAPTGCPATNRAGLPGQARPGCQGARCPV